MTTQEQTQLQFRISQLRQDKIIYAVESCAISIVCLFGFLFSNQYFAEAFKSVVNVLLLVIAVGYLLYMGIGNFRRLQEVQKLEKKL